MPKVSVVIPNYNHGEFLPEAIASVASMSHEQVEVIVVDDGSTDERTRREVDNVEASGIHVIRQPNKGLAAARNAGIAASSAEFIFPLDADDRLHPAYIEKGIQVLDANSKIGVVYADGQLFGVRSAPWPRGPFDRKRLLKANFIAACALFRRVVWEQNGGYDERMTKGLEDWDFWLGAVEHGWEFHYIPEILFDYRTKNESMITHARGFIAEINQFVAAKHGPLYRDEWIRLSNERESGKATLRNLRRIITARLKMKLHRNGNHK